MKYDHIVKINGEYYPAGAEVPDVKDRKEEDTELPFSDSEIAFETEPVRRGRPKRIEV